MTLQRTKFGIKDDLQDDRIVADETYVADTPEGPKEIVPFNKPEPQSNPILDSIKDKAGSALESVRDAWRKKMMENRRNEDVYLDQLRKQWEARKAGQEYTPTPEEDEASLGMAQQGMSLASMASLGGAKPPVPVKTSSTGPQTLAERLAAAKLAEKARFREAAERQAAQRIERQQEALGAATEAVKADRLAKIKKMMSSE